jgi:hypothetical protein
LIHDFKPPLERPYVQEINYYQELAHKIGEPLIIKEWDNEYAPEVAQRLLEHIRHDPEHPHVAPYLLNIYFADDGQPLLFWAHRIVREEVRRYQMEEIFNKLVNPKNLPLPEEAKKYLDLDRAVNIKIRYPAWISGGEPEADQISLGFTYLPYSFWARIYPEIKDMPWNILDVEISARMIREALRARVHWDCVVNHSHVDIRPQERSIMRKRLGIDKSPLTDSEKVFLKMEKLPKYQGFLTELSLTDSAKGLMSCPVCSSTNTVKEVEESGVCRLCKNPISVPRATGTGS